MQTSHADDPATGVNAKPLTPCMADDLDLPAEDFVPIAEAAALRFRREVLDFHHGALASRHRAEGPCAAAASDKTARRHAREHLVHRHPRAAVLRHELMLGGD